MKCERCRAVELALAQCINRLYNQGGDISAITHEINMETAKAGEAALKMRHRHPLVDSSVGEALNEGDGTYKP